MFAIPGLLIKEGSEVREERCMKYSALDERTQQEVAISFYVFETEEAAFWFKQGFSAGGFSDGVGRELIKKEEAGRIEYAIVEKAIRSPVEDCFYQVPIPLSILNYSALYRILQERGLIGDSKIVHIMDGQPSEYFEELLQYVREDVKNLATIKLLGADVPIGTMVGDLKEVVIAICQGDSTISRIKLFGRGGEEKTVQIFWCAQPDYPDYSRVYVFAIDITASMKLTSSTMHLVRNIAQGMMGNLEMLQQELGLCSDEVRSYILDLFSCIQSQSKLSSDLLRYMRISAGRVELKPEVIELQAFVDSIFSLIRPSAKLSCTCMIVGGAAGAGAEVGDVDRGVVRPLYVKIDKGLLQMILHNLLDNAAQHTPQDGQISVGVTSDGENLIIEIQDSGEGIPEEKVRYLFDSPFLSARRVDKSAFGFGLASVAEFIKLADGSIEVETRRKEDIGGGGGAGVTTGTKFRVRLPYMQPLPEEIEKFVVACELADIRGARLSRASSRPTLEEYTPWILLADDDPLCRKTLSKVLQSLGCEVDVAENGENALDLFRKNRDESGKSKYFCVFTDMEMGSGMNGFKVAKQIRSTESGAGAYEGEQRVPIYVVSGNDLDKIDDIEGTLRKPVMMAELKKILEQYGYRSERSCQSPVISRQLSLVGRFQRGGGVLPPRAAALYSQGSEVKVDRDGVITAFYEGGGGGGL